MTDYSIAESYNQYFDIQIADTDELRRECYGIRYRVYAEEFGFEKAEEFPDKIEFDEYDHQSIHCLVTHKSTGRSAGCVRMVPTFSNEVRDPLPMEKYCGECLDTKLIEAMALPRESICEISRLAVDGAFRQRRGERKTRFGSLDVSARSVEELRTFPLIAVSAFLSMVAVTILSGRPNAFMMTEPFLPRLLSRSGIIVERVGRDVDYHGVRAPYFVNADQSAKGLVPELRELYDSIYSSLVGTVACKEPAAEE